MKYLAMTLIFLMSFNLFASSVKDQVQSQMKTYVNNIIKKNGFLPILHKGHILKLSLKSSNKYPDGFHAGVKESGNLFTSCADFKDAKGNSYDVDFLVSATDKGYRVVQPIVHSVNGKKSKYDLKH